MLNRGRTHTVGWRQALRLWHAVRGSVRVNNTVLCLLLLSAWSAQTWAQCTNCTTTLVGGDVVHTWTANGIFTPPAGVTSVQVLVVGGGGGGGFPIDRTGGGGGAGGLISNAAFAVAGTQTVTVGAGGNGGTSGGGATAGGNSVFGSLTANGGGRGGTGPGAGGVYATAGGSGGGGYHNPSDSGKAGTAGQGNAGGSGYDSTNVTVGFKAGGGGGAGGAGTTATPTVNGAGGAGLQSSISGTATFYAGGGGGGIQVYTGTAPGGSGVGGDGRANGLAGTAGMANRGGGGGGGSQNITTSATGNGGDGGSGIVIVRYSLSQSQTMSPGACTSLGGSGRNWTNPGSAVSSNNAYATSQTLDGQVTDPLQCLNFGFSIPLTATVNGIQVFVERKSTVNGGSRDDSLFLVKAGATVGNDLATTTAYTNTDVIEAHGGSSEMWGTTWTPAQINAANFGTVFTAIKPSTAGATQTITVDHIFITVYYTISSPVVLPDSFDAVEVAATPNTPIKTKLSGASFTLDVLALDSSGNILTGYLGTVTVEIVNAATGGGVCAAMTSLQNLGSFAFIAGNAGRRSINTFNYANAVPNARIRITDATAGVIGCSFDNFAIRPSTFGNFSVTDNDWQTAGTARALATTTFTAGSILHKAGRPFTVRADALNAAGVPAVTTGYTGSPAATITACAGAACTPTFGTLTLGTGFTAGQLNTGTASYNEVGSFRLQLVDSTFAAVDAGDSSALEREIRSGLLDVGRFVPDNFAVSLNAPAFGTACGGGFSYIGQPFEYTAQPVMTVTARDFANNTTALYAGAWWRISSGSLTPGTQIARYSAAGGTLLDVSNLPAVAGDPAVTSTGSGAGTLTFSSGTTGLLFSRAAPVAPFDADISLAVNVIDADGVSYAGNPARFGQATAGNGMLFLGGKQMRYGRLRLSGANGSPLLLLRVPVEAQYWNGSAFITNVADTCTTLSITNIGLGNYILNPLIAGSGTTSVAAVTSPLSAGRSVITLNKPAANVRSVDVAVNLGPVPPGTATADACSSFALAATAANKSYLRGNWCNPPGTYTKDPAARARFGIMRGSDEAIYTRETTN